MAGGRPTKYDPSFDDLICELAAEGKGPAEWAYELRVDRSTLYRWANEHESFATAIARAKDWEMAAWERMARENLKNRNFNAQVWSKSVSSRFPRDYTERKEIDNHHTGDSHTMITGIQHRIVYPAKLDLSKLSEDELEQLASIVESQKAPKPLTIDHEQTEESK